ncbi:DUF3231 family protein [Niallia circulans]|uniref:DUF3231 family protein n=1 Tax=Niallia circulans TaxID=1397 RepID=A0A941GN31_NIACI|nr:DUF3231 family protein [Niallia circulans]MCB5238619.1 DUF3231 family protein [Niallia circulans]
MNNESIQEHQKNKQLTSSELADLFANYMGGSMLCCVFDHFLQVVEDGEVKNYIEFAITLSQKHLKQMENIFNRENIPIPVGFGEQDVRKDGPRLFSDIFMIFYITQMAGAAVITYGHAYTNATRQDIMDYFRNNIDDAVETYEKGIHLLLLKGVDISHPTIPYPKKVDFVEKKSFISIFTGRDRPLTANEIKHYHYNIITNILGKSLMIGFSQVASSEKLREYFQEGAKLASKQIKIYTNRLINQDLPSPKLMDTHITDSTASPFSDKLLMYHVSLAGNMALANIGTALSEMLRHDLAAEYIALIPTIGKYNNDGLNIMIEQGWLEEPYTAADRKKLSKHSSGNQT